ncbi:MAG: helix-turn-helix transcriptional regulator [Gemmatimonadota bacterium]|jgi:PadR family transcriptional regulator PadR
MMDDSGQSGVRVTPVVLHVLLSLAGGDAHAYGIMKDVQSRTGGRVSAGPGSLHYTLTRLQEAGFIEEAAGSPGVESDARRKYFHITASGRRVLEAELSLWADVIEIARARDLIPGGGSA